MEVLDHIRFELDLDTLSSKLHVDAGNRDEKDLRDLLNDVTPRVNPKAIYDVSYVEDRGYDTVAIGGVTFTSRVLRVNLDKVERVFPYVATCGRELDEIELEPDDLLKRFWLDTVKGIALGFAVGHLNRHLDGKYLLGKTATMNPGSADKDIWPIEQQKQLFSVLGDVEISIGVRLTDSFLMIPNKSLSGIRFPTELDFRSCQVCQRENCPSRQAPFDENLLESYHADAELAT